MRPRQGKAGALLLALALGFLAGPAAAANYVVSTTGNDAWAGDAAHPWRTLQKAANSVTAGANVTVLPGTYTGFYMTADGTPTNRITFSAQPGVVVNQRNASTPDGINLEDADYVTLQGFTMSGNGLPTVNPDGTTNPTGTRAGIRVVLGDGVIVRNNTCDNWGVWGIFMAQSYSSTIENNTTSRSVKEHGIYFSDSGDDSIIRNNTIYGNTANGIHLNPDTTMGDGLISRMLISGNRIYYNGGGGRTYLTTTGRSYTYNGGGAGINMSGVCDSTIVNNLLYDNYAGGMTLYHGDGAAGSSNNTIVNNTVVMAPGLGRNVIQVSDDSHGNKLLNNIFYSDVPVRTAISVMDAASLAGFVSDYNVLVWRTGELNGYVSQYPNEPFAPWQALGYDTHSQMATLAALFVDAANHDYHLLAGGLAVGAGTGNSAPLADFGGRPRPVGGRFDIGAYEWLKDGDVNGDNRVNLADLTALATCYGAVGKQWCDGDFNGDGLVNLADLTTLATNYGWTGGGDLPVPEPAAVALLLCGAAGLLRRRRGSQLSTDFTDGRRITRNRR